MPGDDVLALGVLEELAVEPALARRGVAREADAGPGRVALVAEDHLDDVHGRAEVVRDLVRPPVDLRARRVPRVEDGADGPLELRVRVLREVARRSPRRRCACTSRSARRGRPSVSSTSCFTPRDAFRSASACSKRWPSTPSTTSPYIWISRRYESRAKRALPVVLARPVDRVVVEPEVEDRVHHPGHRDGRARSGRRRGAGRPDRRSACPPCPRGRAMCSSISASSPAGSSPSAPM